jgi:hypothetical protein
VGRCSPRVNCRHARHREYFLSLAKKWEDMARNLEREVINESRALILRVEAERLRRRSV